MKEIFRCNIKGHFINSRQNILRSIFVNKSIGGDKVKDKGLTLAENIPYIYKKCIENVAFIKLEPDNPLDPNAIAVFVLGEGHIGYIPKEDTFKLREVMDFKKRYKTKLILYQGVKRNGFKYDFSEVYADLIIFQ